MATLYVKAAGGNSNAAGTWSNVSSLGVDNSGPPSASDDCIADLNSGQLTVAAALSMKSFSTTDGVGNYANTITHNAFVWTVAGNFTFTTGTTYTPLATSTLTLSASSTLTTAGLLMPLMILNTGITATLGDNLSFMASKVITLTLNGNSLDLNGKTVSGNSATNRLLVRSNTLGTPRTITMSSGTFANADFRDITTSPSTNLSGITGNSGDCGGNTGTFTTAATQTWSGTVSDSWSTNAWSGRVPLPQDDVLISSAFSSAQTITQDMPRMGKSIDMSGMSWSGTATAWAINSVAQTMHGSLTLKTSMTVTASTTFGLVLEGRGAFRWNSAGVSIAAPISLNMNGGSLTLDSALATSSSSAASLGFTAGNFDANGYNVTCGAFTTGSGSVTRTITMGAGTWTSTSTGSGAWNFSTHTNVTLTSTGSTNAFNQNSASSSSFQGGGLTYNNFTKTGTSTGSVAISGSNTFGTVTFDMSSAAKTLTLTSGTTQTISSFVSNASSGKTLTLNASTGGSAATLTTTGGIENLDYLSITDTNVTPASTWYYGNNSTYVSGTGWTVGVAPSGNRLALLGVG